VAAGPTLVPVDLARRADAEKVASGTHSGGLWSTPVAWPNGHQFERGAHCLIGAAPGKLGGEGPEVDLVFLAEADSADPVLFVVMSRAEADPKRVMGFASGAGIGGGAEMRKFAALSGTARDTTAMRPDPAPMTWPDRLQDKAHAHFGGF
jgi:hypothetical protein